MPPRISRPFGTRKSTATPVLFFSDRNGGAMTAAERQAIDDSAIHNGGDKDKVLAETGGFLAQTTRGSVRFSEIDDRAMKVKSDIGKLKTDVGST